MRCSADSALRRVECFVPAVRIEDRFTAIAHDPVGRLLDVHRASLAVEGAHRPCEDPHHCSRVCDPIQCRIIINALRREIDRLLRGIDRIDALIAPDPQTSNRLSNDAVAPRRSHSAEPGHAARPYAPPPIGYVPAKSPAAAARPPASPAVQHSIVSAGGTLVDILI